MAESSNSQIRYDYSPSAAEKEGHVNPASPEESFFNAELILRLDNSSLPPASMSKRHSATFVSSNFPADLETNGPPSGVAKSNSNTAAANSSFVEARNFFLDQPRPRPT